MTQVALHALAVAQALFLPGYVIWRMLRLPSLSLLHTSLLVACLSLLGNFALVSLTAALRIALPHAIWPLLALEAAAVVALAFRTRRGRPHSLEAETERQGVAPPALARIAAAAGVALAGAILLISLRRYGSVFEVWDPVFSWNEWALDWWSGRFPDITWMYPQLVPANWAMTYAIVGSVELQALPKAMMALYPVGSVLLLAGTGIHRRSWAFLLAAIVLGGAILAGFGTDVDSGGVEFAAGFFALAAVCFLPDPRNARAAAEERQYFPALAFAVASACTKQSGLLVLAFVAVLVAFGTAKEDSKRVWPRVGTVARLLGLIAAVGVIAYLPGYLSMPTDGLAATSYGGIQAAMGNAGFIDRLAAAYQLTLREQPWLLVLAMLVPLALARKRFRTVGLFLVVPWLVVWAGMLSYDFRNLGFILPLWCLVAAGSVVDGRWADAPASCRATVAHDWSPVVAALGLTVTALAFVVANGATKSSLESDQLERQARIASPAVNAALSALIGEDVAGATILTDYRYLPQLPLYRADQRRVRLSEGVITVYRDYYEVSAQDIDARPDMMILSDRLPESAEQAVRIALASREYVLLAELPGAAGHPEGSVVRVLKRND